jgi:hypothetical protein
MKGSGINAELPFISFVVEHLPFASLKSMFPTHDYLATYGRRAIKPPAPLAAISLLE